MAHRLNLACTDSIKKNEFMLKFRDKFNALYWFISASSNRTQALKNIQKILDEPEITIKEPYSIRWLGLRNAVRAVYECFGSVLVTLSKFSNEKNAVAKGLSKYFCSYKVVLVTALVLDLHNELAVLSCGLQKNNLLFSEVKPLIDGTVSKLTYFETNDGECLAKMRLLIKKTDDGVQFEGEKLTYHANMDSEFENVRADYIQKIKKNIGSRFRKQDSAIYEDFSCLFETTQLKHSSKEECENALESLSTLYGYEKSVKIVEGDMITGTQEAVKTIEPLIDAKQLEREWPRYEGMAKGAYADLGVELLCKRIICLHGDIMPNVSKLTTIALCLQPTSVECERSFSTQNRLKCKFRASLGSETLNTLMTISMLGQSLSLFDASPAVKHWLRQKRRRKSRLCTGFKPRPTKVPKLC